MRLHLTDCPETVCSLCGGFKETVSPFSACLKKIFTSILKDDIHLSCICSKNLLPTSLMACDYDDVFVMF